MMSSLLSLLTLIVLLAACHQNSARENTDLQLKNSITTPSKSEKPETSSTNASPRLIAYYNSNTKPILKNAERLPYTHYILIPDGKGGIMPSKSLKVAFSTKPTKTKAQAVLQERHKSRKVRLLFLLELKNQCPLTDMPLK